MKKYNKNNTKKYKIDKEDLYDTIGFLCNLVLWSATLIGFIFIFG